MNGEGVKKNDQTLALMVGGNAELRKSCGINANSIGILTHFAANGLEALEMLEAQPYHFVISDIMLPKLNGLLLLAELRRRGSAVPFIVLCPHNDKELVLSAYHLGILDYLPQSVNNSTLKFLMIEAVKLATDIAKSAPAKRLFPVEKPEESAKEAPKLDESVVQKLELLAERQNERKRDGGPMAAKAKDPISTFVGEARIQLQLSENAIRGLHNEKCDWELGYLNRVMSRLLEELKPFGQNDIISLVRALKQCFSLYKIRTSMLTYRELIIIKRAHKIVAYKIEALAEAPPGPQSYPINEELKKVSSDLSKCLSF